MSSQPMQEPKNTQPHTPSAELTDHLSQPGVLAGIQRGVQDSMASRTRPWSEVKIQLGLR